ncbi:tRNA (uridine(34)/cytosine(34)/5-carboxymethylaminomethyluridine(34)-2'-O)-methyltransferase TrmL [Salibacterium halotolerans]|uniref:Putative tRNA (cytidine(34)-2'-O)-methyltransferase n=1 Tax=Salibacterium halotolerans TaxID=1884432 RepID=A0A1I5UJR8_9BACI|nr:tRNA (uridine(34)/cytosine(34)/5-carboxymethylaminomethyluridine(34)-2'-O)-methyltransferase TrmL [Salibacterium halotolerans]SFP95523.1 tRNA (cytidine/uridine-2'-O-)-methyltransferase [Salibacterium halotolerans]
MSIHIVLYHPEIPANTGNIARTCAGTGVFLHLVRPLGFSTDDKMLKRAGCDYWPDVQIYYHDSLDEVNEQWPQAEFYLIETNGSCRHTDFSYEDPDKDYFFVFGSETTGLPESIVECHEETCLRIPQNEAVRSFNLSNSAAIIVFEALRQQQFPGLS